MANLTITTDDEVLKKARMRALQEGTSVNAVLREFMESYAGLAHQRSLAIEELLSLSRRTQARRGQRQWSRDELHERK